MDNFLKIIGAIVLGALAIALINSYPIVAFLIVVVGIGLFVLGEKVKKDQDEATLANTFQLLRENKFAQVITIMNAFIREHPDNYKAFNYRALAKAGLELFGEAKSDFERSISLNPNTLSNSIACEGLEHMNNLLIEKQQKLQNKDKAIAIFIQYKPLIGSLLKFYKATITELTTSILILKGSFFDDTWIVQFTLLPPPYDLDINCSITHKSCGTYKFEWVLGDNADQMEMFSLIRREVNNLAVEKLNGL